MTEMKRQKFDDDTDKGNEQQIFDTSGENQYIIDTSGANEQIIDTRGRTSETEVDPHTAQM